MGEHDELLAEVKKTVKDTLTQHHKQNGYVTQGICSANTALLREGMKSIAGTVERVHEEMCHQRKATNALGKITGTLSTELVAHKAEHAGEEKAEDRKTGRWRMRLAVFGAVVAGLVLLAGIFGWAYSMKADVDAMRENPPTIVISKEAAKEIAKAVNGDDEDEEIY